MPFQNTAGRFGRMAGLQIVRHAELHFEGREFRRGDDLDRRACRREIIGPFLAATAIWVLVDQDFRQQRVSLAR